MARTYLPTLLLIARTVQRYTSRYDKTIRKNMDGTVEELYDALLLALDAFLVYYANE